ncbi:type IV pilus assembly protein PilM [Streptomyces sp. NP160]|uniref:type IV pilus assembly protein PilM n=1 Tax=Streptomyces sp. NP160 TaxID=2586637 RepID=UPI0015D64646|nr:type IV pilus assembly protein PilM [Streptomyces sp. NP160]
MSRRTTIGLDIGSGAVRAAELSFGSAGVVLERCATAPLPASAVRDGEVVDTAAVSAALVELWRSGRFSHRRVTVGIANPRVVVREVEMPHMPAADLKKALPFQVQDVLPMPVDAAVLDFHPLEVRGTGPGAVVRGLLVAAWRDTVLPLVSAVHGAKLLPEAVDLTAFAVLRAVGSGTGADAGTEAIVDIGSTVTQVVVHSGGAPHFVRILLCGGDDITGALAERAGLSTAEAERLKRELDTGEVVDPSAADAVRSASQTLLDEVRSTIDYATATSGHRPDRVVLTGGGARQGGLDLQLSAMTGLPVEVGSLTHRIQPGRRLGNEHPDSATMAVGLALGAAS